MAYEEFQVRLSHLNLKNLCLEIGYEKDSATRNSEALKAEVKDFLKEYEIREHMIPPCGRADPVEARLCATNFLVEEGRGERLFPPNPEGAVVWSTHRALIIEALTHIFRLRAFNNKQLRDQKARRDKEIAESENATQKRTRRSGERGTHFQDNELYERDDIESSPDIPLPNNLNALDPAHYLKPWHEDPERFNRRAAISHIKDLNPFKRQEVIHEFTHEWLSKSLPWPPSADPIVAQFMHQRNFYVAKDLKMGTYREVVDKLRTNTELSSLNGPQYMKLERRVGERIKHLTAEFYSGCFLQTALDGSSTKTKRFQQLWESREEHWKVDREATTTGEDSHRAKRRKRTTKPPAASKSPVIFPNISMPPEMKIRGDLRSMAGSVLEHLNIGAKINDPIEEYIVITPKASPLVDLSRLISASSEKVPDGFTLNDHHMPYLSVHEEVPPPTEVPHPDFAPPIPGDHIPKTEHGVFNKPRDTAQSPAGVLPDLVGVKVREDNLMPVSSPELNHSTLNSSSHHYSLALDNSSSVKQDKSPRTEPLLLPSLLTEHTRTVPAKLSPNHDESISVPELKNDYEIWRSSSGLYQMCLKHGLKEFPGLSERVQTELWGLEAWLHPETTSDFTLRNFCSKHNILGGVAQYKDWWAVQNETERNKRLHPNHRVPKSPSQNSSPIPVSQTNGARGKSPAISSNSINSTASYHVSPKEATGIAPTIRQSMGDAPLQHHHHYISHSQPRSTVPLDAQALCDGGHQAKYATLEQEVQRLQVLSQKPGGIPHFGSELDRGQFLLAHGLTELGFRHWEERYRTQNLQAVINGSSTQENMPVFHEETMFTPHPQNLMSQELNHSQTPARQFASPQDWVKMTQQSGQVSKPNDTNMQSLSPKPSRSLQPKAQNFTPYQWSPPDTNNSSSVKQNFTPVPQPRILVAERKPKRREKKPSPHSRDQLQGSTRNRIQFIMSPNSEHSNNVWREVVNIPGFQSSQQSSVQQMAFPPQHQSPQHHSSPTNIPQYIAPIHGPPTIDANTYNMLQTGPASNPTVIFATPPATASKADPITPSRTPSPNKAAEVTRHSYSQDAPSIRPSIITQATPEFKQFPHPQNSPTPSQTYPPTPSTIGPSPLPITIPNPNNTHKKTLDFIFQLPTKDLDFDSPVPFPSLEKIPLLQFFELFAEKTVAKLEGLERVIMTPAFGHQQSFVVERFGEDARSKWEKVKGRLRTMWMQQVKREPEKDDFEIWVELEG